VSIHNQPFREMLKRMFREVGSHAVIDTVAEVAALLAEDTSESAQWKIDEYSDTAAKLRAVSEEMS
jgi:hypothetical protein